MKTTAVADLKSRLSSYLRMVKSGEEILVTERDVPVAKIVPIGEVGSQPESLRDLERRGLVRLGTGRLPRGFWRLPRGRDSKASLQSALREERERGW
ncbi:MAG: type II toxin-antitoxin system Phd/YefM family antitoxin [Planctomycetota bacterium]|jgi:prevent-host-death family protein